MQQVADWLAKLGMSEYAKIFAENRIDFSILPDLTEQDLKDLGVVLGDRRKLLRATGELGRAAESSNTKVPVPPLAAASPRPAEEAGGERRYLTVMFCDLV